MLRSMLTKGRWKQSVDALVLAHPGYDEPKLERLLHGWSRSHVVELYEREVAALLRYHWEMQKRKAAFMLEVVEKFEKGEL